MRIVVVEQFGKVGSNPGFDVGPPRNGAIILTTGPTLNGRVLARVAAVTLDTNTIVKPTS